MTWCVLPWCESVVVQQDEEEEGAPAVTLFIYNNAVRPVSRSGPAAFFRYASETSASMRAGTETTSGAPRDIRVKQTPAY